MCTWWCTLFLPPSYNKVDELRTYAYTENFSVLVLATAGPEGSADRLYRSNPWFVNMPVSLVVLISPYFYQKEAATGVRVSAGSTLG